MQVESDPFDIKMADPYAGENVADYDMYVLPGGSPINISTWTFLRLLVGESRTTMKVAMKTFGDLGKLAKKNFWLTTT